MAKHRELSSKIWRTIVVSGAMLATPVVVGCGGGNKPVATTPAGGDTKAGGDTATPTDDKAATDKAAADKAAADQAAADKAAADKVAADKAAADQAAADKAAADKAAADKAAADAAATPRPRGGGNRPKGRGFVLA